MGEVVQMFEWKRLKDLDTPLDEALRQSDALKTLNEINKQLRMAYKTGIPPETVCMCSCRERLGEHVCIGCPINDFGPKAG